MGFLSSQALGHGSRSPCSWGAETELGKPSPSAPFCQLGSPHRAGSSGGRWYQRVTTSGWCTCWLAVLGQAEGPANPKSAVVSWEPHRVVMSTSALFMSQCEICRKQGGGFLGIP